MSQIPQQPNRVTETTAVTIVSDEKTGTPIGPNRRLLRRLVVFLLVVCVVGYFNRQSVICPMLRKVAESRLKSHQVRDAEWWVKFAVSVAPDDPSTSLLRAKVLRQLGDMEGVSAALKLAESQGASQRDLKRQQWLAMAQSGQIRQAEPHLSSLLTDRDYDNKDVCLAFVIGYLRTQQTNAATALLDSWIADEKNDATPYLYRARIRNLLSQPDSAEEDFRAAIEIEPNWPQPVLELGELLTDRKKYQQAKEILKSLVEVPDLEVRARIAMADCELSTGNTTTAVSMLSGACALEPNSVDARIAYGNALVETGQYSLAVKNLKLALDSRPNDDEAHYLLAQAYSLNGDTVSAAPHFEFVKEARTARDELDQLNSQLIANPKDAAGLIRAGEILLKYGNPEEGVIRIMAGLDIAPTDLTGLTLLARHYKQKAAMSPAFQSLADHYQSLLEKAGSQP